MPQDKRTTVIDISTDPQGGTTVLVTTPDAPPVQVNIPPAPREYSMEVHPSVVASWLGAGRHIDGCDTCLSADRGWYLLPVSEIDDGNGGTVATYRHSRCGRRWATSWAKEQAPGVGIHGRPDPSHIGDTLRNLTSVEGHLDGGTRG